MEPVHRKKENYDYLLVVLFSLLFIALILAGYFFDKKQRERVTLQSHQKLIAAAESKQQQISQWLYERKGDCNVIKDNSGYAFDCYRFIENKNARNAGDLDTVLNSILRNYNYENVFFLSPGRKLLLTAGNSEETGFTDKFYSLLNEADSTGKIIFSGLYQTGEKGDQDIDYVIPLSFNAGKKVKAGFIVLRADPKIFLYPILEEHYLDKSLPEYILIEKDNNEYKILEPLAGKDSATFEFPDYQSSLFTGITGDTLIEGTYKNIPVIAAAQKIKNNPWIIIAMQNKAEVFSALNVRELMIGLIVGLIIIGLVTGGGLIMRHRQANFYRRLYREEKEKKDLAALLDYVTRYANDIIFVVNIDGVILDSNEAASEFYHYTREEFHLMDFNLLRTEGYKKESNKNFFKEIRNSGGKIYEAMHFKKDGTIVPVEASTSVIEKDGQVFLQFIIRDITDRKKAELHQNRLNRLYEITGAVNQVISHHSDLNSMLNELCRVIAEKGKYKMCWVGNIDGRMVLPVAFAGEESGYLSTIVMTMDDSPQE